MSSASKRANGRASGPVLQSVILAVLDHSVRGFLTVSTHCADSVRTCDDAGFADEGVGERGLAVVHVGNHRHVTDVPLLIHDLTDLVDREVHHLDGLCLTVPMK